jgi:hypothetical protein
MLPEVLDFSSKSLFTEEYEFIFSFLEAFCPPAPLLSLAGKFLLESL